MANYFSIFLVVLTLVSGLIWLVDSLMFASKRRQRMELPLALVAQHLL